MVTVTGFKEREGKDGKSYPVLEISGEIDIIQSKVTGRNYLTARKAFIAATFSIEMCKSLIGRQIPGCIKKVKTEKYEFTIPETGKVIELDYRWDYSKDEDNMEAAVLGTEFPYEGTFVKTGK